MTGDQYPLDSNKKLSERLDVDFALKAAGLGVWEYDPVSNQMLWDDRCRALFGLPAMNRMSYEHALEHVHPDDVAQVNQAIQWAMNTQSDGIFDQTYRTIGVDDKKLRWVRFQGKVHFAPSGEVSRFAGVAQEVTQQVMDKQQLVDQQVLLHGIVQQTPAPTLVLRGSDYRIDQINAPMLAFMGRGEEVVGQPFLTIMPELADQFAWQQVQRVYQEGVDFDQTEVLVPHVRNGTLEDYYYNVSYRPLREGEEVTGMIQVAIDVTQQVLARQQVEQARRQVLELFEQSPVGIAIISEDKLTFQMVNSFYGYLIDRAPQDVVGKPLLEALPELKGQGFDDLLREVLATGTPFVAKEVKVELIRHGRLETIWVDLTYQPRREADNRISGILVVATDVTQQVTSRQALQTSEARLRSVVESAPFPIAVYVGERMIIQLANRSIMDAWGKGYDVIGKSYQDVLPELANQPIFAQVEGVRQTGIAFHARRQQVDIVVDGRLQPFFFNYSFTPLFDESGEVYGVMNTAAEVTDLVLAQRALSESEARYKALAQDLERQVKSRTQELAAANAELATSNLSYATLNRDLQAANNLLTRSNENLQTFAYVASHDLQEPLRKIQQFGDLLKMRLAGLVGGEELVYLERMQSAAGRMYTLIKDLLAFSRISTQRDSEKPVSLNAVVSSVLSVLDMTIEENQAQVQVDSLPTVLGDAAQFGQLFQNLIGNALKFHRPGVTPQIHISSQRIKADDLPPTIKPVQRTSLYHRIKVSDNGIGFDEKYLDRIFQVFQRLHGRSEYMGTGIGLAICERVVVNHGGAITATSQPGQGATFIIYLPV